MRVDRRDFLSSSLAAGGVAALHGLAARLARSSTGRESPRAKEVAGGYGPLRPSKAANANEALLALPEGFHYTVFGRTGTPMSDGLPTPRGHDGMAAFADGKWVRLVRNHEINGMVGKDGVAVAGKGRSFDKLAGGGTTTLLIDPRTRLPVRDFVSLSGTLQNCAGGPTPWGSWISCEETVLNERRYTDQQGREWGGFGAKHGYCFEVPAFADGPVQPSPLKGLGRFVHEAVAVDPSSGVVYETEDTRTAGFYRFVPKRRGVLSAGGRLQMLAVKDRPGYDARGGQKVGAALRATWVEISDPDPVEADVDPRAVFRQGRGEGGVVFTRLEGCWHGRDSVFFTSTNGGEKGLGQVWEYRPVSRTEGQLTLIYESSSEALLKAPDNLCVSPRGGLVICEDGRGAQHLRGLTAGGQIFDLAVNVVPGFENMEFAGATFSPDGRTLFVNIQTPGLTFAIWGPWEAGAL